VSAANVDGGNARRQKHKSTTFCHQAGVVHVIPLVCAAENIKSYKSPLCVRATPGARARALF